MQNHLHAMLLVLAHHHGKVPDEVPQRDIRHLRLELIVAVYPLDETPWLPIEVLPDEDVQ
jgi:hypothetical protein